MDEAFLRRLDRLALRTSRFLAGNAVGERPGHRRLPASDFREHRLYVMGDDVRHVDWNASARQEHIFVKLGDRPREVNVRVMLDVSQSMNWGRPSKFLAATRLTAALGYLALTHSDRLTLVSFAGDLLAGFGPSQGKGRVPGMLKFVQELSPAGETNLAQAVQSFSRRVTSGGYLILVSDVLDAGRFEEALSFLPAPTWQVLVVHLLHPHELAPVLRGEVELADVESAKRSNYDIDGRALEIYRSRVLAWCETLERTCAQNNALYVRVLADWPLETAVLPCLRARQILVPA